MINGENIIIDGLLNYHRICTELKKDYDEYIHQDWTESGEKEMEKLKKKYPPSLGYHASLDLKNYQIIITHE